MRGRDKNVKIFASFSFYIFVKEVCILTKLENKYQKNLIDRIKSEYPGCVAIKNDSGYIQGIPDWTILYEDKWAVLEVKRHRDANKQPNQEYYVDRLNKMSFSRFVYPENEEEVLDELRKTFKPRRASRSI